MQRVRLLMVMVLLLAMTACAGLPLAPASPANAALTATPGATLALPRNLTSPNTLDPSQISLNTQGLPYPWQANAVAGTPYDNSQPPGPLGLPDHIQVNFGTLDPALVQPTDPILYLIPVNAYQELWAAAGDETVTELVEAIYRQMVTNPNPPPTAGLPVLPMEHAVGVNDIAVQVGKTTPSASSASKDGFRFVGRFAQSPNPLLNGDLHYIYQGFTNDGVYLVLFFYPPVATTHLADTVAEVPQAEMDQVNADPAGYTSSKAAELNALPSEAWEPDLAVLDALVGSLTISNMPQNGIEGKVWQWVGRYDGGEETPVEDAAGYTISFLPANQFAFQADCNRGSGVYEADGGMIGSLRITLGPVTPADCGPASLSNELIGTLQSAQNYKVRPGGQLLELVRPAGGGSLLFALVTLANEATSASIAATAPPATLQTRLAFTTTASVIDQGQCATLIWEVENVRALSIYPLVGTSANGPGSQEVCPQYSTTYELRALLPDGRVAVRQVTITVEPANARAETTWLRALGGAGLVASNRP